MRICKKLFCLIFVLALVLTFGAPALASADDGVFVDVPADAWFAEAVEYCRAQGLMNGTSDKEFEPESSLTRAMLVTVLYRAAGEPVVSSNSAFTDVAAGQWYSRAILWATQQNLINGYGGGLFGPNDNITQEQLNIILGRYTQQAVTQNIPSFTGSAAPATRAQVAAVLLNLSSANAGAKPQTGQKILIAYFTVPETSGVDAVAQASRVVEGGEVVGNVEFIAKTIQAETGGDLFAIETVQTYPGEHQALLNFAAAEMAANARPQLASQIENLADYDVIFLGYPIWNADLPMPVYSFLDVYDLSGKTVIPFTAHGGSGFAGTISVLAEQEPGAQVERNGFSVSRSNVSASRNDIVNWLNGLTYITAGLAQTGQAEVVSDNALNVLVAYFSQTGTTERVARQIAEYTGGDLAQIQRAQPYADLQNEAQAEIENNSRPEITVNINNLAEYDVIFVGYPIWWDEAPAMISAFLAENNFSGKVVAPFCTSSYSLIDNSLHIFRELAAGAVITNGLTANESEDIKPWVEQIMAQAAD